MPLQIPQLDDRNFEQIVNEVVARIPAHTPEWNNFNQSDPGITLVQLFAYMMENLLYRSNRIPEANRLKFLSLLRLPLRPAGPGYGLATFLNDRGPVQAIVLDSGLELYAGKVPFRTRTDANVLPVTASVFYRRPTQLAASSPEARRTRDLYQSLLSPGQGTSFEYYETVPLEPPAAGKALPVVDLLNDTIDSALWIALVAPKKVDPGLVRQALDRQNLTIGIYPDINTPRLDSSVPAPLQPSRPVARQVKRSDLVFELAIPPTGPTTGGVRPAATYLPVQVEYAENVLDMPGVIVLRLPPSEQFGEWDLDAGEEGTGSYPPLVEDRELASRIIAWIRVTLTPRDEPGNAPSLPARLSWVGINCARVIQSLRVTGERIGIGTGTPSQSFKVANTPVIVEHPLNLDSPLPEVDAFRLELVDPEGKAQVWQRVDDIYSAAADDMVYTLDPESGQVQCGDGLRGKRFPVGHVLRATYEYGGGSQGQLAVGALNKAPNLPGGIKVRNPVETWGASDGETVEAAEQRISRFLRHRDRLVTAEDFREIAMQTPNADIGRVEVLPLFDPTSHTYLIPTNPNTNVPEVPGTVTVMVVPRHPLEQTQPADPDKVLLDAVRVWLEPRRLLTSRVFVRGPQYVPLAVSVALELLPGQISAVVFREVTTALRTTLSPLVGGIPPKGEQTGHGYPLLNTLRREDLEAVVARVSGVRFVYELRMAYLIDGDSPVEVSGSQQLYFAGLRLPWLTQVDVRESEHAGDPTSLVGGTPSTGQPSLPVPVKPIKKC